MAIRKHSKDWINNQCYKRIENGISSGLTIGLRNKPTRRKFSGGKGGGGAKLTEAGEKIIVSFYEIEKTH